MIKVTCCQKSPNLLMDVPDLKRGECQKGGNNTFLYQFFTSDIKNNQKTPRLYLLNLLLFL